MTKNYLSVSFQRRRNATTPIPPRTSTSLSNPQVKALSTNNQDQTWGLQGFLTQRDNAGTQNSAIQSNKHVDFYMSDKKETPHASPTPDKDKIVSILTDCTKEEASIIFLPEEEEIKPPRKKTIQTRSRGRKIGFVTLWVKGCSSVTRRNSAVGFSKWLQCLQIQLKLLLLVR